MVCLCQDAAAAGAAVRAHRARHARYRLAYAQHLPRILRTRVPHILLLLPLQRARWTSVFYCGALFTAFAVRSQLALGQTTVCRAVTVSAPLQRQRCLQRKHSMYSLCGFLSLACSAICRAAAAQHTAHILPACLPFCRAILCSLTRWQYLYNLPDLYGHAYARVAAVGSSRWVRRSLNILFGSCHRA